MRTAVGGITRTSNRLSKHPYTMDYDTFEDSGDDFISMGSDLFGRINWKIAMFLFVMGVFIMSDVFIDNVLAQGLGYEVDGVPTTKGTLAQLLLISITYIALDLLLA
jgi:hypothetical protein